jgi:MATE family multidrug resistance protein
LLYVALREVRYAYGDATTPMRATVAAQLVNIALALVLVRVLGQGVAGASFATVVAHTVEAGVLALTEKDRRFGLHLLSMRRVVQLVQMGLPTGVQFALEVGAFATLSVTISMMSETQMAAHQIALQIIHFSFLPAMAVAEAASVLIGQAVGAAEDALVPRIAGLAMRIAVLYSLAWSLVFASLGRMLMTAFTPDAVVLDVGVTLLLLAAVFQCFDAANIVSRCALRGAGDVRYAAWVGVLLAWLCTPTLAWWLGVHVGWGAAGGWIGLSFEVAISAGLLWRRLVRGGWRAAALRARSRLATDPAAPGSATAELAQLVS